MGIYYKDNRDSMRLRASLNEYLINDLNAIKIFECFSRLWSIEFDMRWPIQREAQRR